MPLHWTHLSYTPGEHRLSLEGKKGRLEAVLTMPPKLHSTYFALLGHPHSLQGGTMHNKVVTTMARAFKELCIPSLRFNFRGVGLSVGEYDEGVGESEDMLQLAMQWQQEHKHAVFIFAGFSFGSYVAYRAAGQMDHSLLICIAPPVHHYDYKAFLPPPRPWLIFQGDEDEVVLASEVIQFASDHSPAIPVVHFPATGHFFHGKLVELKTQLMHCIEAELGTL